MATSLDGVSQITSRAVATLARTDTTAKNLFVLKAGTIPLRITLYSGTASNAGTSATVSVGRTGTNNYFLNAQDVKTNAGQLLPTTNVTNMQAPLAADTVVTGIYAETGTPSNAGGPFYVQIDLVDPS